jgi:ribose transport system substrate-binding protein
MTHVKLAGVTALVGLLVLAAGCGDGKSGDGAESQATGLGPVPDLAPVTGTTRIGYVTNGVAQFWTIAEVGARAAGKEFGAEVEVHMPPGAQASEQKATIEDLVSRGVHGIAISPIDGENQNSMINDAAKGRYVITHDSDAPHSQRICYVGVDNYIAGRQCGELVKEALPDGGKIIVFVGRLSQANAKDRRQGVLDELMDLPHDRTRFTPPGDVVRAGKYTILRTMTDAFSSEKAKANAEDAIAGEPDLACMVGLFAYNAPMCLEALDRAGKRGKIKVVSFDEDDATLQGILDGTVHGTVVQNPYRYGYESVRILAGLARGDRSVLPKDGFLDIPARQIRLADADAFWTELKDRLVTTGGK